MALACGSRKSETATASSLSIENQLLADIEFHDDESQTKDDEEDSIENPIDPFSTKQFQSKRGRGFRKKPRPFNEDDIEALQQLSCAKAFSKFHSQMTCEAQTDESIGDYLKACALLATKLRHCKNEFLDGDNADQQIENYYKDRPEEYSTLSKQEFLTLAERYKSDIHHTIDKWLKKRSKSRSHAIKANPGEYKRNMLSDTLQALANKQLCVLFFSFDDRRFDDYSSRSISKIYMTCRALQVSSRISLKTDIVDS